MVDAARVRSTFVQGVTSLRDEWNRSGWRHARIEEAMESLDNAEWCRTPDGIVLDPLSGSRSSGFRVAILEGNPSPRSGLHLRATLQTTPHTRDEVPTVYIRNERFSPLWAGMGLIHETEHAMDYRDGISEIGEPQDRWDSTEGRVHGHEATILEAISGGNLSTIVAGRSVDDFLATGHAMVGELASVIPARLRRQPYTPAETGLRQGALLMSGAIIARLHPRGLLEAVDTVDLGSTYRRVAHAFG